MIFVLEKNYISEDDDLIKILENKKIQYELVSYKPFDKNQIITTSLDKKDVVFIGTINFAKWLLRNNCKWLGLWASFDKFKCSNYYNYIGKYLINQDYVFTTPNELIRKKNWFNKEFGEEIFIRPDLGTKPFTGNVINLSNLQVDLNYLCRTQDDMNQLVNVSKAKKIKEEYRFFCFENEPITYSRYHLEGEFNPSTNVPKEFLEFAKVITDTYQPEKSFVIDIGIDDNNIIGVMEYNCFSCSGMYSANLNKIIEHALIQLDKEINYKD